MQYFVLLFFTLLSLQVSASTLNPISYGLRNAKDGKERFAVLMKCHQDAVRQEKSVSYDGIDTLELEIPINTGSIPLPKCTDFAGVTIIVQNDYKPFYLFSSYTAFEDIAVSKVEIDRGIYTSMRLLKGKSMLLIEDAEPWVDNRQGFSYGATRRDVVLVEDGTAINKTIYKYNTQSSDPKVRVIFKPQGVVVKNLNFCRTNSSTQITFPIIVTGADGVEVSNIVIHTPQNNTMYGDAAIRIVHSANISLCDISIFGTYSHKDGYGYGVNLENVYNVHIKRMYARARWGVFGTNNTNTVLLTDCDINRFDIHCYGKDVKSVRCKYSDFYNQFSSVFGKVEFYNCEFTDCIPVLMESSYNAYTPFDINFQGCSFNMSKKKNYLITLLGLEERKNSRPELARKALPNIQIKDCEVNLPKGVMQWYVINTGKVKYKETLDYISSIDIDNLLVSSNEDFAFDFFSTPIKGTKKIKLTSERMYVKSSGRSKYRYKMQSSNMSKNATVRVNGKRLYN